MFVRDVDRMDGNWLQSALKEASIHYGFQIDRLAKLGGGFENRTFGFESPEKKIIIRVTPPGHKTPDEVREEINWLSYLFENGAPVVCVKPSQDDNLVEVVDTEVGLISVVCFDWAQGQIVTKEDFSPELFETWGQTVGMLHRLTKDYHASSITGRRIQWYDDEYLDRSLIPSEQIKVLERFDSLIKYFKKKPTSRDSFGLIHQDVHKDNLFLNGKQLTVLDFDDCVFGFFIFDIANALGFTIWEKPSSMTNREFADYYLKHFMIGYERENQLEESWQNDLHKALKLFEFIHYNAFNMDYDLAGAGSFDTLNAGTKQVLRKFRDSIERDLPFIENALNPYR